jgi:hypothetical protein
MDNIPSAVARETAILVRKLFAFGVHNFPARSFSSHNVLLCALVLTDDDCAGSLTCFQRNNFDAVPGCIGEGEIDYDYCI